MLDHIGMSLDPQLYFHSSSNFDLWHYVSGLLFINQTWWNTLSVGSDLPYWSLGFEVPFYIMFGIIFFQRRTVGQTVWAVCALLLMMIVLGPTVSIMFPLWLLGYFGFKMMKDIRLPPVLGAALWLSTFVLFYVIKFKT